MTDTYSDPKYDEDTSWVYKANDMQYPVDVFYVYPTICADDPTGNMDITDPDLRIAAQNLITTQAGVFSKTANIFAPYYRQMSKNALGDGETVTENVNFMIGYGDVKKAFAYYLKELNTDRPFFLAGHSQGTMTLIQLMRDLFGNEDLQKRLVSAYLIGYSIMPSDTEDYSWIQPAQHSTDTGVIVTYNTEGPNAVDSPVRFDGAYCINPLNWKTNATFADKSMNKGAVLFESDTSFVDIEVPFYCNAQVNETTGALVTMVPDDLDTGGLPDGVLHRYDYELWYRNLENNVMERWTAYRMQSGF